LKVIINSSPIISLSIINKIDLLWQLFEEIYIPSAVLDEIIIKDDNAIGKLELKEAIQLEKIKIYKVKDIDLVSKLYGKLHKGELEVIIGGKEINADFVVLDEISARNFAQIFSLVPIGTIGILRLAKKRGFIESISPYLTKLKDCGFRISIKLIEEILNEEAEKINFQLN